MENHDFAHTDIKPAVTERGVVLDLGTKPCRYRSISDCAKPS
jgi:hypothetical protein